VLTNDVLAVKLNAALSETSDVYVNAGVDANEYFEGLRKSIKEHQCAPYLVFATVMPPGFPNIKPGTKVSGYCVAKDEKAGYWLVYSPEADTFYCLRFLWSVFVPTIRKHWLYFGWGWLFGRERSFYNA
jgi:hypothetical protein